MARVEARKRVTYVLDTAVASNGDSKAVNKHMNEILIAAGLLKRKSQLDAFIKETGSN